MPSLGATDIIDPLRMGAPFTNRPPDLPWNADSRDPLFLSRERTTLGPMHRGLRAGAAISAAFFLIAIGVAIVRASSTTVVAAAPVSSPATTTAPPTTPAPATTTTTSTTTPPETAPPATTIPPPPIPHPGPPKFPTTVAVAKGAATGIYYSPGGGLITALASPVKFSLQPLNFEVLDQPNSAWLHVLLRTRPNQSKGYIKAADVTLSTHTWSIDVDLTAHWITIYQGAAVWLQTAVVTGTDNAPTPLGDYFTTEGVWETNKWGAHGPFVFGLSGHSDVFSEFDGGDGQIGIHGTNQPYLLGSSASHGCIRIGNEDITRMANTLPMGVPVHIHA